MLTKERRLKNGSRRSSERERALLSWKTSTTVLLVQSAKDWMWWIYYSTVFYLPVAEKGKAICQIWVSNIKALTAARNCLRKKASFWESIKWASRLAALTEISVPKIKVWHIFNNLCIQVKARKFDTRMFEKSLNGASVW